MKTRLAYFTLVSLSDLTCLAYVLSNICYEREPFNSVWLEVLVLVRLARTTPYDQAKHILLTRNNVCHVLYSALSGVILHEWTAICTGFLKELSERHSRLRQG